MHDPNTVAFDISFPLFWKRTRTGLKPRISLVTIWHRDPEKDGDENSCDWHGSRFPEHWLEELNQLDESAQRAVRFIWWMFHDKLRPRPWWRHPKWHIHHWRIQLHLVQRFKRWMWSRCQKCGRGFSWHDAGGRVVGTWGNTGPTWFRNGEKIWHMRCEGKEEAA